MKDDYNLINSKAIENKFSNIYIDEGLKLAGFSENDIHQINH